MKSWGIDSFTGGQHLDQVLGWRRKAGSKVLKSMLSLVHKKYNYGCVPKFNTQLHIIIGASLITCSNAMLLQTFRLEADVPQAWSDLDTFFETKLVRIR